MRDTVKTEEYFRERYNEDTSILDERISKYKEVISHPEKYDIESYKYHIFMDAAYKFYAGYSLGLGMNELLPEVDLIIRNLIDTRKEMDRGYDDMEMIIYLIILFNRTEFLDEYNTKIENAGFLPGLSCTDSRPHMADKYGKTAFPQRDQFGI